MVQIPDRQKVINYFNPIVQHRAFRAVCTVVSETIKIIAAKIFLEFLGNTFLVGRNPRITQSEIYKTIVLAPVSEEIIFRLIIMQGIHLTQKGWNCIWKEELTERDLKIQQVFRVFLSAFIFGAAHLLNPHQNLTSALTQFTWTFIAGVLYGYLSEKYQTISVSILFHGINNFLAFGGGNVYPVKYAGYFIAAVLVNKVAACVIAFTSIEAAISSGAVKSAQFFASLPDRIVGTKNSDTIQAPAYS